MSEPLGNGVNDPVGCGASVGGGVGDGVGVKHGAGKTSALGCPGAGVGVGVGVGVGLGLGDGVACGFIVSRGVGETKSAHATGVAK